MANRKFARSHRSMTYVSELGKCVFKAGNPKTYRKGLRKTNAASINDRKRLVVLKSVISFTGLSESAIFDGDYTEILTVKCKGCWWSKDLIEKHFSTGRCTHSYDCCGNMYNSVYDVINIKRHEWKVVIGWNRNV